MLEKKSLKEIFTAAYKNHILIPAFNVPHSPMLEPIVETLKAMDCFGLVELAKTELENFGAQNWTQLAEAFERCADRRYVRLHQDHVPVIDEDGKPVDWKKLIRQALDLNYDSVMVDGSRLPLEENIRVTREVVEMAAETGAAVEAELGAVLGHEAGPLPPYEELFETKKGFTDIRDAEKFVRETEVDWLSVAVGNIHGAVQGSAKDQKKVQARLDIDHLQKISEATNVPLVLHGGSGIDQACLLDAVKNGITKINIGTAIRQTYEKTLKMTSDTQAARRAVAEDTEKMIRDYFYIQGSAAKLSAALDEFQH